MATRPFKPQALEPARIFVGVGGNAYQALAALPRRSEPSFRWELLRNPCTLRADPPATLPPAPLNGDAGGRLGERASFEAPITGKPVGANRAIGEQRRDDPPATPDPTGRDDLHESKGGSRRA